MELRWWTQTLPRLYKIHGIDIWWPLKHVRFGKRKVYILLECFLVILYNTIFSQNQKEFLVLSLRDIDPIYWNSTNVSHWKTPCSKPASIKTLSNRDKWILRASDWDSDNCLRFRFGHWQQVNCLCPALNTRMKTITSSLDLTALLGVQWAIDTGDLLVTSVQIWIWDNFLNLNLNLKLIVLTRANIFRQTKGFSPIEVILN